MRMDTHTRAHPFLVKWAATMPSGMVDDRLVLRSGWDGLGNDHSVSLPSDRRGEERKIETERNRAEYLLSMNLCQTEPTWGYTFKRCNACLIYCTRAWTGVVISFALPQ